MSVGAGTVDTVDVILKDLWPDGAYLPHIPTSGFTGSDQNNVASVPRGLRLGTKVKYHDVTAGGEVTMIYLHVADNGDTAIAPGAILRPAGSTDNADEGLYVVSNDTDDHMFGSGIGPAAIAISAVTDDYKTWAWCAGFCPQDGKAFCSLLAAAAIATYLNAGHSAAGSFAAGTAGSGDAGALIELAADTQSIFGWITAAAGATAT